MSIFSDISALVALARLEDDSLQHIRDEADAQARAETILLTDIKALLVDIKTALVPKPATRGRILINGGVIPMGFQLQDVQKVTATFQFTDADGNPAPAPAGAVPQWASSDVTKATVAAAADGMSATIAGQPERDFRVGERIALDEAGDLG